MDRQQIILVGDSQRAFAIQQIKTAPQGYHVVLSEPTRSLDQNAKLWPMLQDVAGQVEWHGLWLTPNDWKDLFTAALKNLRVVPNIDGTGFVALGQRTSTMSKRVFSDLITLIYAFGDERGVQWSEPREDAA